MQKDIQERHRLFAYHVKRRLDAALVIQRFFRHKRALKSQKNCKVRLTARSIENFKKSKSRHRKPMILDDTMTSMTLKTSLLDKTAPLKDALAWNKATQKQSSMTPKNGKGFVRYHEGKILIARSALNHILIDDAKHRKATPLDSSGKLSLGTSTL